MSSFAQSHLRAGTPVDLEEVSNSTSSMTDEEFSRARDGEQHSLGTRLRLFGALVVGGTLFGSFLGVFVGALFGIVLGVVRDDLSIGYQGALIGSAVLAGLGCCYGVYCGLTEPHR